MQYKRVRRLHEANDVDRADLEGNHGRRKLGEEPPRIGGESLDPEAASHPRPLPREWVVVERVHFVEKEGAVRDEGQHQGA